MRREVLAHKEEEKKKKCGSEGESWRGGLGKKDESNAGLVCEGFSVFSSPRVLNKPPNVRNVFFFSQK